MTFRILSLQNDFATCAIKTGTEFIIDAECVESLLEYQWHLHSTGKKKYLRGYKIGMRKLGLVYMHRILVHSKYVDHKNGDGLDNRKCNLREATSSQNNANRRGVSNVWFDKALCKYRAEFWKDGKKNYVGLFDDIEEAKIHALKAKQKAHGEFSMEYVKG